MLTVFVFVMNIFSLPGVILICCSEFYFAVTVVGHRTHLTIPNADALKASGVKIFVVAVGNSISGIDELVKVASNPFRDLLRVQDFSGFWTLIQLAVKLVSPGKYQFVDYTPPCN